MDKLFEDFLNEKRYLQGVSKKTLEWYTYSYKQYKRVLNGGTDGAEAWSNSLPTKHTLIQFVIGMRKNGLSSAGMNDYIRGFNVFLAWLHENEHIEQLKIKRVKQEETIIQTFTDKHLEAFIRYKPKDDADLRLHTLILFLIDTGCRIEEAITLVRENVDLDSLAVKVRGKGGKERIVPISLELRKRLFKFLRTHEFDLVFCTRHGKPLLYRNSLRDFKRLGKKLGIKGVRVSWHTLRHTFAYNYVKGGGNIFYLQRAMGHTDLAMTKRYVNLQTEDLQRSHVKLSTLARLRS
ncbi:MAG TPA: site-specific integrase [Blastocatellia bacterium]|jgi:integrase/recombinase XerD